MGEDVERGPLGHRRYRMDFIDDPDLFKAVVFSRKMISGGTAPGIAHARAAKYYGVSKADVAHYAAQYAGSMGGKVGKRKAAASRRKRTDEDDCSTCFYGHRYHGEFEGYISCCKDKYYPRDLSANEAKVGCGGWKGRQSDDL